MAPAEGLERVAADALMILLHLAVALGHIREGNTDAALEALSGLARSAPADPSSAQGLYRNDALYWRARLGEAQGEREALRSAVKDYVKLLALLPDGHRRREVQVRLAGVAEPGRVLTPEEAREASRRNLELIGLALHAYAADNGGALPRTLFDLVGEYVTDPQVLLRPGRFPPSDVTASERRGGGGRIYEYTPGLRADALRPAGAARTPEGGPDWEVPVVVREPAVWGYLPGAGARGFRLVLGLDGAVRSVQEKMGQQ